MDLSTPAGEKTKTEFAALVGIDWADRQHAWSMRTADGQRMPYCEEQYLKARESAPVKAVSKCKPDPKLKGRSSSKSTTSPQWNPDAKGQE
jgi:hypothetical protein